MKNLISTATAIALALLPGVALAHASLSPSETTNGTTVKVAIAIPHGCDGAATDTVIVKLPEGFVSAKPQVKTGWALDITKGDYQKTYSVHGSDVTSGALEVKWSGGSVPDDAFDEFVIRGTVQGLDAGGNLPFVVTQLCGTASVIWDQIAAEGQDAHSLEHPAPFLKVTVADGVADAHGHDHGAMANGMDHSAMTASPSAADTPVLIGDLAISGAFTRATLPNAPVGGGFLTITNTGSADDRLVSATSPAAEDVQIHEMKMDGDMMKMSQLPDGLVIPAGQTVTLAPGGYHLMFMKLKAPFVEGQAVPVTLTFEKAGTIDVRLEVGGTDAKAPEHQMHGDAEAPTDHAHHPSSAAALDTSGMSDVDAIAAMQKAMFDKPDNPLTMGPIIVVGEYAVSDWAQAETGGRALLRKTGTGWGIYLCAGDGLRDAAELAKLGVPADIAAQIAERIAAAEATVDPALLRQFSMFDGTMMVDEQLM